MDFPPEHASSPVNRMDQISVGCCGAGAELHFSPSKKFEGVDCRVHRKVRIIEPVDNDSFPVAWPRYKQL